MSTVFFLLKSILANKAEGWREHDRKLPLLSQDLRIPICYPLFRSINQHKKEHK
jgi:hypothetical protein